jgi:hypothetical protein
VPLESRFKVLDISTSRTHDCTAACVGSAGRQSANLGILAGIEGLHGVVF